MKRITNTILIMFALLTANAHAYRWTMSNFTKRNLLLQVELLHSKNPYFVLVKPRQSADFDWTGGNSMAGFCLGKIKYLIPDERLLSQKNLIDRDKMEVKHNGRLIDWLDDNKYERKEARLQLLPDELYDATVEEAKRLSGTSFGATIVGYFADLVSESMCRSRDISIVERNGEIGFYALKN